MNDPTYIVMALIVLVIAIPVHEFAHALSAVNNGDDGPRRDGRLTIFPWDHFDLFGAIFCVLSTISGMGLGWGRPVIVNPEVLHDRRWGMCKIAAWGPLSNLLLAAAMAVPLRILLHQGEAPGGLDSGALLRFMFLFMQINLGLMLFNLIPIGPLDGVKVLAAFLPPHVSRNFMDFQLRYGMIMLLLLIMFGRDLLGIIIGPPMLTLMELLLGRNLG
jgi:Zn-dependent protease